MLWKFAGILVTMWWQSSTDLVNARRFPVLQTPITISTLRPISTSIYEALRSFVLLLLKIAIAVCRRPRGLECPCNHRQSDYAD